MNTDICAFCDRTQFEERLVGESKNFWIIATFGQISDGGYLLLVPKRHVLCLGLIEEHELKEMEKLQIRVCEAVTEEYGTPPHIVFEHGIVGQTIRHAHLHLIPELGVIAEKIYKDFSGSEFHTLSSWSELTCAYAEKQKPYLLWKDFQTNMTVCWDPKAPLQYLRIVVAQAVGRPERANWRTMDPELDRRLWSGTVTRLKPYLL
jgi:diadenosine tetraphosphate (Ap4A) HIT family hydrolase